MSFTVETVFVIDETPEEALGSAEQKREISMGSGDEKGRALGLIKAAEALALMGRVDEGQSYASEAMAICSEMKFEEGKAASLNALTAVLVTKGGDAEDLEEAVDSGIDALKLFRKLNFKKGEAAALMTLSKVYAAMSSAPYAIKYSKEAIALFAEIGEGKSMAAAYQVQADAYLVKSDTARALKALNAAYKIFSSPADNGKMAVIMRKIAKVQAGAGDYANAFLSLSTAKQLYVDDYFGQAAVLETLMDLYLEAGMYFEAIKLGQDRVNIFHDAGDMTSEGFALLKLGTVQLQSEDHEKAEKMAELALGMLAGVGNMEGMKQAKDLLDDAKHEAAREKIGMALHSIRDYVHIPSTLIVDPGLNSRVTEAYSGSIRA